MPALLSIFVLAASFSHAAAQCGGHDHAACARFMSNGFCTNTSRSLEFRQRVCGRGCGLCLDDCHDSTPFCHAYARTGFCDNDKFAVETKRSMCQKTCFCDRRTTTLAPEPEIDAILPNGRLVGPQPVPVVPAVTPAPAGPMPVPVVDLGKDNSGPQPVPVLPGPSGPEPVPVVTVRPAGPEPVPVVPGPTFVGPAGPEPVPDLTGSDPNPAPVPVVAPKTGVLLPDTTTELPRRPFTTCGLLKDDENSEVFVVHEGVSMDLARHPFNDRATSVLLLPDCSMDLWEHVGQAGNMIRFHSSSEHTFKLDGPYRRAISSLACRCN